jgi:hypothetical protein
MSDVVPDVIPFSECKCDIPVMAGLKERLRVSERYCVGAILQSIVGRQVGYYLQTAYPQNRIVRSIVVVINRSLSTVSSELSRNL